MSIPKPSTKPADSGGKLSLAHLTPEQALFKALNTAPPKPVKKVGKRKGKSRG